MCRCFCEKYQISRHGNQLPICLDKLAQEERAAGPKIFQVLAKLETTFHLGGVAAVCFVYNAALVHKTNRIGLFSLPDNRVVTQHTCIVFTLLHYCRALHFRRLLLHFFPAVSCFFSPPFPLGFIVYFTVQLRWREGRKKGGVN